ncbi:ImmA/IrrE family metallo-endopeptidase [Georgenia sp. TF02-10]|nr:ImmA/IrrE family metallo-endopeptidase [Georgenia sp. TF02-10]
MTQEELAEAAQVTQAALSRYEHDLRAPEPDVLEQLARALGVTPELLQHGDRMRGGIAVTAHMRRRATAKVSVWRSLEARLNMLRLHTKALRSEVGLRAELQVPAFDPAIDEPQDAARMVRLQWHMPVGPVHSLAAWMEAAGILIFEEDFGSAARVDGLSQWSDDYAVVMLNSAAPPDRKRLTLAHELGHLVLHSQYTDGDLEGHANAFAAELLMPAEEIKPMLRSRLTLARFVELKRYWGTSIAALIERAYQLGVLSSAERASLYKQMNNRRWRIHEPASDEVPIEAPRLVQHVADQLAAKGLDDDEIARLAGFSSPEENQLFVPRRPDSPWRHLTSV